MNSPPRIGVFPAEGLGRFSVQPNVAQDLASMVGDGSEDTAIDHFALQFGKPDFDLVQPRGIRRREMQLYVRVRRQELMDQGRFVSTEVVENDMDLALGWLRGHTSPKNVTNSWLVCRVAVCPITWPVCGFKAAYRDSVP